MKAWLRVHERDLYVSTLASEKKENSSEIHAINDETLPDEEKTIECAKEPLADEDTVYFVNALAEMSDGDDDASAMTDISELEAKEVLMTMIRSDLAAGFTKV